MARNVVLQRVAVRKADEFLLQEIEGDGAALGPSLARLRHHRHELIPAKRPALELAEIDGVRHDPEIGHPLRDGLDDDVARPLLEVHVDVGVFRQKPPEHL